jgi:site-specific DNA-methyltransferase (adenine-specific)
VGEAALPLLRALMSGQRVPRRAGARGDAARALALRLGHDSTPEPHRIECVDAQRFAASLPDGSVQLILTDPPYNAHKAAWDKWPSDAAFLAWMGEHLAAWRRVLARNGTLYVFGSSELAGRLEGVVRDHFHVLNHVVWAKPTEGVPNTPGRTCKEAQRAFFPYKEHVIVAEQKDAESDYDRGDVHAGLWAYLDGERERAGFSRAEVDRALGCQMSTHWFGRCQWELPTGENYARLRALFARRGRGFLARSYDDLRAEYDAKDLEYQAGRRPFAVSAAVPSTDVWQYDPVPGYPGKHPTEKPPEMGLHIVEASSRPGDVVADFFSGSGTFPAAAAALGRVAWACDIDPRWATVSADRVRRSAMSGRLEPALTGRRR